MQIREETSLLVIITITKKEFFILFEIIRIKTIFSSLIKHAIAYIDKNGATKFVKVKNESLIPSFIFFKDKDNKSMSFVILFVCVFV